MRFPKVFYTFLLSFCFNLTMHAQNDYVLVTPTNFPASTTEDVIHLLEKGTKQKWNTASAATGKENAIVLSISPDPKFTTKESFHIRAEKKHLTITSSSIEGLTFGLYKHLRSIGFRFYLPGDLYTVIPEVQHPFGPIASKYDKPFLQVRQFFGTGGFGSSNTDPDMSVQKEWMLWKIRNGFGSAYELGGHRGENFILENKSILAKKPGWLAGKLSGNDHADQGVKLNYLDKEAVAFYTDWSIRPFTNPLFKPMHPSHSQFVSMEPSDGGGFINEQEQFRSKKIPSISDQVYAAANLAAQKLEKKFPGHPNIGVNLYAYSSHAAPPSFKLHPRVFVQIIPFQFQNVAFGPSFIKMWAAKAKRFAVYDYLRYTDANFDLPGGITVEELMKRLVFSVQSGSEGTTFETSYSKFSTGIPLYLAGRYMSDGQSDWYKEMEELVAALYPSAQQPMKALFTLLFNEPSFTSNHLGNAASLLKNADQLVSGTRPKSRINELKDYLHFVHLVYVSRDPANGSLEKRLLPLSEFAWKVYESKIIHSYRIMQLVSYAFLNSEQKDPAYKRNQQLHVEWFPETPASQAAWKQFHQGLPKEATEKNFSALTKIYPNSKTTVYEMSKVVEQINGNYMPINKMVIHGSHETRGYFAVYADKPTSIKIRYKLLSGENPFVNISVTDKDYAGIQAIQIQKASGEVTIKINKGETSLFLHAGNNVSYRMEIQVNDGIIFFDGAPRGNLAFYKSFDDPYEKYTYDPDAYPSYIYIPAGLSEIYYTVQLNALEIKSGNQKIQSAIRSTEHGGVENRIINAKKDQTNRFWKAQVHGNFNYKFVNIPDRYFLIREK